MRVDEIRVQIAARPTSTYTTRDAALIGPKIAATRSKSNAPTNNQLSPPITSSTSANQYEPFIGNSSYHPWGRGSVALTKGCQAPERLRIAVGGEGPGC